MTRRTRASRNQDLGGHLVTAHAIDVVVWVICPTENDIFVVKGVHGSNASDLNGREVCNGEVIRLEHVNTKRNLHSHMIELPGAGQNEVTCYGTDGTGDGNDDWRVEIEGLKDGAMIPGCFPSLRSKLRLIHCCSGRPLHSHAYNYDFHPHQQQVVTWPGRDSNDFWAFDAVP